MFAELTYIIYGAATGKTHKLLEGFREKNWEHWRDPAKDVQEQGGLLLTPCEQASFLGPPTHIDVNLFKHFVSRPLLTDWIDIVLDPFKECCSSC